MGGGSRRGPQFGVGDMWRVFVECVLVVDFMILFRESVRVVQFTKKSRSFVRSVVFPVAVVKSEEEAADTGSLLTHFICLG